jgi:hypothetical protein
MRTLLIVAGLALSVLPLQAQDPVVQQSRLRASAKACDMRHALLMFRVVDASDRAIPGAVVRVRRVRGGTEQTVAGSGPDGSFMIAEDGSIPNLRASGEPFEVIVTAAGRTQRQRLTIGMDANQCHVTILRGPAMLRF